MIRLGFLVAIATACCQATASRQANQFIVLDRLPDALDAKLNNNLTIRTNFPGSVEFIESDRFHIDINVTSANVEELAKLHYNYTTYDDEILLQLFEVEREEAASPLPYVLLGVSGATVLALFLSTLFACWWNHSKRPHINDRKETEVQDASRAPLLSNTAYGESPENRLRQGQGRLAGPDGYASSEEEYLREHRPHPGHTQPRFGHPPNVRVRSLRTASDIASSEAGHLSDSSLPTPHDLSLDEPFPPPPPPEKPVVSYIKVTGSEKSRDQEGIYSDIDGQTTLKVRFEEPPAEAMPDVIRSQVTRPRDAVDMPIYSTVNKQRGADPAPHRSMGYSSRGHQDSFSDQPPHYTTYEQDDELQRIYNQSSGLHDPGDPYSSLSKLSGSNVASILTDRNRRMSPNAPRPPGGFSKPHCKDNNMEQVELDSVGSSRSGESSRSSGIRTQSSYTDSNYSSDRRAPIYTDSDSAHSSGSSANRSRDSGLHGIRYYAHHPPGENEDDRFLSPSASDPSSAGSSSSPRMVDEAYGTFGSTNSYNATSQSSVASNGAGTLRSCSTASTGSGSSGSVVTVINTDDPSGLNGRKRVYFKQGQNGSDAPPARRNAGGRGVVPTHYLQTSVLCCLSLLCLTTGVYSHLRSPTTAHIKVYAPSGFLYSMPKVYTVRENAVRVSAKYSHQPFRVLHYPVEDTYMSEPSSERCGKKGCQHGCDPRDGHCVCRHGYQLASTAIGEPFCTDFNECAEGEYSCHKFAECKNFNGHYICDCQIGFYGNGEHCTSCSAPCLEGTFEVNKCSNGQPKHCQECTKECPAGQYIRVACTPDHDIKCAECSERCRTGQYEYTPCNGTLNRKCRDIGSLPAPTTSKNVISENRLKVSPLTTYVLHQDPRTGPLTHVFTLNRKTGISVTIRLRESNLAPLFRAVDHSGSHDNEGFPGDSTILQDYCPYPVPEKYQLSLFLHRAVTTKASFYNCQERLAAGQDCESGTGYYLNPHEPCTTYSQFGDLPDLDEKGWNIVCSRPGKLSEIFGVTPELDDLKTMYYVDEDSGCAGRRTRCDQCSDMCAKNMESHRGMHRCNITAEESDNGESPRLQYCYGCCNKQDCSSTCEVYHNPTCNRVRCVTGNIAEFRLRPQWEYGPNGFACHIEPVPKYKIYDVEYSASVETDRNEKPNPPINNRVLRAAKLFEGIHPETNEVQHDFLRVLYGSEIVGTPNLLQGNVARNEYTVGYYQAAGESLERNLVKTSTISVRPKLPFDVSTRLWKRGGCDTPLLEKLVDVDSPSLSIRNKDPFRPERQLLVQYVDRATYQIYNRSESHYPYIYFEVPRDASVLGALYDATTVKDDSSLHMEIKRDRRWNLKVTGQLQKCPGYFNIKVRDSNYPSDVIFHYDVGVDCPKTFSLTFHLATEGPDSYEKRYLVEITDSYRTIKATVVRPVATVTKETYDTPVSYDNKGEVEMSVFSPVVAVMSVVIGCLFLLLIVGFLTEGNKNKEKAARKSEDKVQTRHLLFVVCYVTFRTAYSVAVTFTVLFLLISYANREPVDTLKEFTRYSETGENIQNAEIQQIQAFVLQELKRQNAVANTTKMTCEGKLGELQKNVEKMKEEMVVEQSGEKLVSKVALEYTKIMLLNLTRDINKFKQEFSEYARKTVDKLTRTITETSVSLTTNKWLFGAKNIREAVAEKRAKLGLGTKPLLEWMGLQHQVESLNADLSLKDFPMPNIQDFLKMETPVINRKPTPLPKIEDITLPRNQWYFHEEKDSGKDEGQSESANESRADHVTGSQLVSWRTMLICFVIVDVIWFIHRMAKTYATAKMVLYGAPTFIDCKNTGDSRAHPSMPMRAVYYLRDLNLRVMKTDFVPKLVTSVTLGCAIYFVLGVAHSVLSVKTLASVGYIESLVAPVETSYQLAKTRIKTNAYRINKFEYPFYEELVNMRTKRYQLMLNMYAELQQTTNLLHDSEFCAWRKLLDPGAVCNCTAASAPRLHFDGCELPPVTPRAYQKKDFGAYRTKLAQSAVPFLNAGRSIVVTSLHFLLLFILTLILVDTLGAVVWIYFKRFNLLRLKPMFEIEHFPTPSTTQF